MPVTLSSSMARTKCRMGPKPIPAPRPLRMARVAALRLRPPGRVRHKRGALRRTLPEDPRDESVTAVHSAAGRHHPLDGRRPPRGLGRLPAIAYLRIASGRLPHDPGANVLSGRQPRSNGFFGHGSSGAPIRTNSWLESNDLHEFLRELDDHPPIQFGPEYRRRRATSPSGH